MSIVVQKYGGSSVATPEKLQEVARRVIETRDSGHSVVVVVSAMADTTDDLLSLAKKVSASPERRELDMLLTAGERISMALLSMAIRELGGKAISFTGSQAGIMTNDRHVDARIIEVRPVRVQDELKKGFIVIVAGYQGMSYKREITTLGRGGSDTTAVALAAALDAQWCEICSDVDGVFSADPRIVAEAQRIPELSYEETRELAENGAKVLNAQAVEFAQKNDIAIYARATSSPAPGSDPVRDGTVVRKSPPREPGSVTGVASLEKVYLLQGQVENPDLLLKILVDFALSPQNAEFQKQKESGKWEVFGLFHSENLHQLAEFKKALCDSFGEELLLLDTYGSVSVVGAEINVNGRNLVRGNAELDEAKIFRIATSPHRITWILSSDMIQEATRNLHAAFFGTG